MELDAVHCYELLRARDPRFDGRFFVGVATTRVYCRPVCTARTPRAERCRFYANAASAEAAGFRPCLRCRPELAPGQAPVDAVQRVARAAFERIEAGALNEARIGTLAAEFGIGERQLRRVIEAEYGVNPLALAQTRRLLLAKQLLTDTQLPIVDVAFASGFASLRQFNRQFRETYRLEPRELRRRRDGAAEAGITLKLGFRPPLAWTPLTGFLAGRSAPGTECVDGARYARTLRIGEASGWIAAEPAGTNLLRVEVAPSLLRVVPELQSRLRRLFDLQAEPAVIDAQLARHARLRPLVRRTPGLRLPGALDGFELALRAVLGQQVTVKAATTLFGRFVDTFGAPIETPLPALRRLVPRAEDLADAALQQLIDRGLTRRRAETVRLLARAVADGTVRLEPPVDAATMRQRLQEIPGIGPWTAEYVAIRAFGDPDAFPEADVGLRNALGLARPAEVLALAEAWRPWRAYAALHLWHALAGGG